MRSFSKKLAFVLAAAMVVTTFAPAASAEAAKEMAINKSSKILYVTDGTGINDAAQVGGGKGNVSSYDFSVKNKPADWKSTLSFKWTSSNEDVATVENGGLVTAVSAGKATISCKITEKATGEVVTTAKTKVTVKKNAAEVVITNADDYDGTVVEVDGVIDLNRAMYDVDGTKTTKRGTVVTDYTKWVAEPAAGVTIDQKSGKFTFTEAAEAGEYKLYCYTYQSSKYTEATATSDAIVVEFQKGAAVEVAQTTRTKFQLTFSKAITDLKIADVTVDETIVGISDSYKVNALVKDVTLNADKTVATVEMYRSFADGFVYDVAVKGYDKMSFTASVGKPASIKLSTDSNVESFVAVVNTDTAICYKLFDANGIDVSTYSDAEKAKVIYTINYTSAGVSYAGGGSNLYFNAVGDSATVVAEYHSYEYDTNGNEKDSFKSGEFTFYGIAKTTIGVKGIAQYALGGDANVHSLKQQRYETITPKQLTVRFTFANGKTNYVDYTAGQMVKNTDDDELGYVAFKVANTDILQIAADGKVTPYEVGKTSVMVYIVDVNGNYNPIAPIVLEVTADSYLASATLSTSYVLVADEMSANASTAITMPEVKITCKDQYDQNYTAFGLVGTGNDNAFKQDQSSSLIQTKGIVGVTAKSKAAVTANAITVKAGTTDTIVIDAARLATVKGTNDSMTFFFDIVVTQAWYAGNNKTLRLTVECRKDASFGFEIAVDGPKDTNIARRATTDVTWDHAEEVKKVTFQVYKTNNGARYDEQAISLRPDEFTETTATGYYYELKKNSATFSGINTGASDLAEGKIVIDFSGTAGDSDASGYTIVDYANGAGTYELILWEVTENAGRSSYRALGSKRVVVTSNAGAYSFNGRKAVIADGRDNVDLLNCFSFVSKDGVTMDVKTTGNNTNTTAKFGNKDIKYWICQVPNADGTIFVRYINFYEEVETGVYAKYTVNVNMAVEIAE